MINVPMEIIVIVAKDLMGKIVAGLSNDDPKTKSPVYKQYHDVPYLNISLYATLSLTFPPSGKKYRFVVIHFIETTPKDNICMAEVQVYVRGMHAFVRHAKILTPTAAYNKKALLSKR